MDSRQFAGCPARGRRRALSGIAPVGVARPPVGGMGLVRQQPPRQILRADRRWPKAIGARDRILATHVGRSRTHLADRVGGRYAVTAAPRTLATLAPSGGPSSTRSRARRRNCISPGDARAEKSRSGSAVRIRSDAIADCATTPDRELAPEFAWRGRRSAAGGLGNPSPGEMGAVGNSALE